MSRQPKHSRLEIPLVSRKINKCQDLARLCADLRPVHLAVVCGPVDGVPARVKSEDVKSHAGSPPTLGLVLVAEQLGAAEATPIVQLSVGEDSKESAAGEHESCGVARARVDTPLASVHVADNGDADLNEVVPLTPAQANVSCTTSRRIGRQRQRDGGEQGAAERTCMSILSTLHAALLRRLGRQLRRGVGSRSCLHPGRLQCLPASARPHSCPRMSVLVPLRLAAT